MIIFLLNYSEATGQIHILSYIQFLTQEKFFIGRKEGGGGGGVPTRYGIFC